MIGRVVEIAGNDRHLSRYRGFMVVSEGREELGRIPLDDIAAVVVTARGASYTHKLLLSLAQKTVPLVLCNEKFLPEAWLWPVEGNHIQAMRMAFQVEAKRPLGKRLWQGIIKSKISHQAAVLEAFGKESEHLKQLIPKVRSGDPDNIEAKAARRYWLSLMGSDFRRERHGEGANPLLNYGYTVIRACAARAIATVGLHPSLGIHHRNRYDHLQLADDIMEPFRPLVDYTVCNLISQNKCEVDKDTKRSLALLPSRDMQTKNGATPVMSCLQILALSVARSFEDGEPLLDLPISPLPLELQVAGS